MLNRIKRWLRRTPKPPALPGLQPPTARHQRDPHEPVRPDIARLLSDEDDKEEDR